MYSQKQYESKINKVAEENAVLHLKLRAAQAQISELKQDKRQLKQQVKTSRKSRDDWKAKYKKTSSELRSLSNKNNMEAYLARHPYPSIIMKLALMLRSEANISYCATTRVLKILNETLDWNLEKIPCANTIQNWVAKTGLHRLETTQDQQLVTQVSLIVDESIRLGQERLLLALLVNAEKERTKALSMNDVEVFFMQGNTSWSGDIIEQKLTDHLTKSGYQVVSYISDEARNMKKAARLLELDHFPDISHAIGSSLKRVFAKQEAYLAFSKQVTAYVRKGAQQDLSYLVPPKQRGKARFLNQDKMVNWAKKILENLSSLSEKEMKFFESLKQHQPIIEALDTCIEFAKEISLIFKVQGVSFQTIKQAEQCAILLKASNQHDLTIQFIAQMQEYFHTYHQLLTRYQKRYKPNDESFALHVSSDIIESIFGQYKQKANHCALTGVTLLNLEIPVYTMDKQQLDELIPKAIEGKYIADLKQWVKDHSTENQMVKRREFFQKCA